MQSKTEIAKAVPQAKGWDMYSSLFGSSSFKKRMYNTE